MSKYTAIIRNGEIFLERWNPETRQDEEKLKSEQVLSDILQAPLVLENTSFSQFFSLIVKEKDLYEKIFKSAMYGHPLAPYVEEIAKPDGNPENLEYVEVFWSAEKFEGDIELYAGFHGYGKWGGPVGGPDMPEKGGIAIEFTGLEEYKMLPLKLDPKLEVYDLSDTCKKLLEGERTFKVYDVIEAILFEITWSGNISKGREAPWEKDKNEQAA